MICQLFSKLKCLQENYPEDKLILEDLYFDLEDKKQKANYNFLLYSIPSIIALYSYTVFREPLPILRRQGAIFGTHRIVRQYALIAAGSFFFAYFPLCQSVKATTKKLNQIETYKIQHSDGYIKPNKEFRFDTKHK